MITADPDIGYAFYNMTLELIMEKVRQLTGQKWRVYVMGWAWYRVLIKINTQEAIFLYPFKVHSSSNILCLHHPRPSKEND